MRRLASLTMLTLRVFAPTAAGTAGIPGPVADRTGAVSAKPFLLPGTATTEPAAQRHLQLAQRRAKPRRNVRQKRRSGVVRRSRRRNRRTGRIVGGIAAAIIAGIVANELARADQRSWDERCRRWFRRCDYGDDRACHRFYRYCY